MEPDQSDELQLFEKLISNEINEYEIVKFEGDSRPFITDNGLLVINKKFLKKLFIKSRAQLLNSLTEDFNCVSLFVLMLNPNVHTAWSKRKELVKNGLITPQEELRINSIVIDKNPKSEHGLMHRRWLIKHYRERLFEPLKFEEFFGCEFKFVFRLADKIKSNYYCWTYLNWLSQFGEMNFTIGTQFIFDQLRIHQNFIELHPSEYCVFHFRLNFVHLMLAKALKDSDDCLERFLVDEFALVDDILTRYPGFMTIWNYRKYLFRLLKPILATKEFEIKWTEVFRKINEKLCELVSSNFNSIYVDRELFDDNFKPELFGISGDNLFRYLFSRELFIYSMIADLYAKSPNKELISKYSSSNEKFLNKFLI